MTVAYKAGGRGGGVPLALHYIVIEAPLITDQTRRF